jgi:multidrug resistance efflux pump
LIVEKLGDDRQGDGFVERVNAVAAHSASALANALEHHSLFLLPLWKALGQAAWIIRARNLPKVALATLAVAAVVGGLVLIPADFDLTAKGKLQPVIRRDIFAQIDGVVVEVPVRHEQAVDVNEVLAKLTNSELEIQITNLIGRKQTTRERINNVQRSLLSERRLSIEERNRLDGELLELRQVEESIDQELLLQQQKQEQLIVRSEMPGQVVTWNVRDLLLRRPVEKGQVLMTVVDPSGAWELELYMPERRMGHVAAAARDAREGLAVSFLLASHPGTEFEGRVVEMQRTAEVRGEEGNAVVLRVAINRDELPELRCDTTVTARVHCGRRGLGYVWFHEVFETIVTKWMLWF